MDKKNESELKRAIFIALGEASMCWNEDSTGSRIFDSTRATEIGNRLIDDIKALMREDKINSVLDE